MKKIIDVSEHQKKIDWTKVSGIDGVIIRIGYGDDEIGQDDDYVKYNLDEVERLGIPHEVYFYSYANCEQQKVSEIAHIKRLIAGRNIKRIWLDLEYRPAQNYWRRMTEAFLQAFPGSGVYSWEWTFTDVLDGIDCPRWICAYGDNTGKPDYSKKPHLSCHGWQYTSHAKTSGINGYVDVSEWYGDFADAPARPSTVPAAGRNAVVNQMLEWEHYSEQNGKFRVIIDGYNSYLPTAVKAGAANYSMKYSDEWCACASSNAYIACGIGYLFPVECSCPRMITLAKSMGIWQERDDYVPSIADAVLYDWEDSGKGDNTGTPDHIGIVIAVDKNKGTFVVMEGNKNESVERRTMSIDGRYIRGFITPKFNDSVPAKKEEVKPVAKTYEISKTGTPSKKVLFTGILMNGMQVTARRQPKVSGTPCSFSPVDGLTWIDVCDYITTDKKWAYCCINGLYGYILDSSIRDYVRKGGQSMDKVVQWVLDNDFGTLETRRKCLESLGYDYDAVQKAVTAKVQEQQKKDAAENPRIRIWAIPPFFEGDQGERLFGDSTAIIQYDANDKPQHAVLIDAGLVKDNGKLKPPIVSKLKAAGITKIDALILSHAHGDHYAMFSDIFNNFKVEHLYLPKYDGLKALGLTKYVDAIKNQAKKAERHGAGYTYMEPGKEVFRIGQIVCECLFQANYKDLANKDGHYAVNSLSPALRFTLGGTWRYHTAGDMQNDANRLMVKAVKDLRADVFKFQWHGDGNAMSASLMEAMKPLVAFSNYHHKERSGRGGTRKKAEAVGAVVARNWENGDIYLDCQGETMKLSCSKGNLSRTFVKKN